MPWVARGDLFSTHYFAAGPSRDQGWKLHVSATPWSAAPVLEAALPILLGAGVSFKVISTRLQLLAFNCGRFGSTQAGKFITVYPSDDDQAVELALALDEATAGLAGPRVPSDRPLRPRSLVHYRYGPFRRLSPGSDDRDAPDLLGSHCDLAGRVRPERDQPTYAPPPAGVADPFERAGAYVRPEPRKPPLGGRYLIVDVLGTSPLGGVYRAVDLGAKPARVCVLKEFWRDAGGALDGRLAPELGAAEADLLTRHQGDPELPSCYGRFELDGNLFVALEYVEGRALATDVAAREHAAERFPVEEVVAIGRGSARALAAVHARGLVFRDFNPANLIRTPGDGYRLIDFGIAWEDRPGAPPPSGLGTWAYCSPQQWDGELPSVADDVFAWGTVMHRLLCGDRARHLRAGPRQPPDREPVRGLRPDVPERLAAVVDRAVAPVPGDRFPSLTEAARALDEAVAALGVGEATAGAATAGALAAVPLSVEPAAALALAREVGDALCDAAIERDGGSCWATASGAGAASFCGPDLYHGAAGIALFLLELGRASGEDRYIEAARDAARWLAGPVWALGRAEPGLYCGESGVGLLFLRLAALLDEPGYLTAAELRARRLRGAEIESLDLNDGAAGLVVFLVRLARATGRRSYLDEALATGQLLIDAARPAPNDQPGWYWPAPGNARDEHGAPYLGLAHGAAGLAFALAELADATGDERALSIAHGVAELLLAETLPDGGGGWNWRESLGDEPMRLQGQCHGAIGIGQLFLRLARIDPRPEYLEAGRQAALTAVREMPRRASPGLCHGLAGDGSMVLDWARWPEGAELMGHAHACGAALQRFRDDERPGSYRSAATGVSRPDLLIGDAGIGWFYLRLAAADGGRDPVLG